MRRSSCPICSKHVERPPANGFFPFCSKRCRLVDLGAWLGGDYRLPDGDAVDPEALEDPSR